MRRFVAGRLLQSVVVVFLVATITFFLQRAAPGDPFSFDNPRITEEIRDRWRQQFGYDRPLAEQYVRYVANVARGDLGFSHSLNLPVRDALGAAIPRTLVLMVLALSFAFFLGIRLGAFEVRHRGTPQGRLASAASLFVYSLPDFWLALMLLLAFAHWWPVLPAGGMTDAVMHRYMTPAQALLDRLRHLVLPVVTLTLLAGTFVARYQRAALAEVLPADFVRTARAKGLDERAVVNRHALRNALLPMITLAGLALPSLLGGAVFVEKVFAWPGMGLLVVNAIAARDYPLVTAAVIVGGAMVALGSLIADIGYGLADPRVRVR